MAGCGQARTPRGLQHSLRCSVASLPVLGEDQRRTPGADGWRPRSEGGSGVACAEGQEDGGGRRLPPGGAGLRPQPGPPQAELTPREAGSAPDPHRPS